MVSVYRTKLYLIYIRTIPLWQRTLTKSVNFNDLNRFISNFVFSHSICFFPQNRAAAFQMWYATLIHSFPMEIGKVGKRVAVYSASSKDCYAIKWSS